MSQKLLEGTGLVSTIDAEEKWVALF